MSSLDSDIVTPGRPEIREVSAGVYAYIQPDGTWWINNTGFLTGPQGAARRADRRRRRARRHGRLQRPGAAHLPGLSAAPVLRPAGRPPP